jgi:hypothetical protein
MIIENHDLILIIKFDVCELNDPRHDFLNFRRMIFLCLMFLELVLSIVRLRAVIASVGPIIDIFK